MADYTPTGNPATDADGVSADMRAEFVLIQTAIATKLEASGDLGTPTSLVLTNATGLPTAGLLNDSVTYAKIQNVSATDKVLGRSTAGSGDVEEITCTAAGRALLDDANAAAQLVTIGAAALAGSSTQVFSVGTPTSAAHAMRADLSYVSQDFRLTLTTGLPVTTADVTGATTIYCTPYKGNRIGLYDGTIWLNYVSAEFSLALGTLTSGKPYDVFCYQNSGTPTLEFLVWTNDTTRATALAYNAGILIKSGDATRRYLGTFYTTATTTTEDSEANRYLWNYYNRVRRSMSKREATASWTYTTATYRQANNAAANQLNFITGVAENCVEAHVVAAYTNTSVNVAAQNAIGVDSTSAATFNAANNIGYNQNPVAGYFAQTGANYQAVPAAGRHFLAWLEYSTATGTTTWYSNNQCGIYGSLMA